VLHQVILRSTATISGISLCGLYLVPRTIFDAHQAFVFICLYSSGLLQILVCLSHSVNFYSILAYAVGSAICLVYYNHSHEGYTFMIGEVMFIESYIYFLTAALYPRVSNPARFSLLTWAMYVIPPSAIMLVVQMEMLQHTGGDRDHPLGCRDWS